MRYRLVVGTLLGLLALSVTACGDDEDGAASSSGAAATSCGADTRKDLYTQGMSKPAQDLSVTLVDSAFTPSNLPPTPGQVQKGMNTITVSVTDAAEAPVDGADLTLALWMPDHAHGSAAKPVVTPKGGGVYEIKNVWLPMAGLWRFTIQVNQAGALKSADFNFCLDG